MLLSCYWRVNSMNRHLQTLVMHSWFTSRFLEQKKHLNPDQASCAPILTGFSSRIAPLLCINSREINASVVTTITVKVVRFDRRNQISGLVLFLSFIWALFVVLIFVLFSHFVTLLLTLSWLITYKSHCKLFHFFPFSLFNYLCCCLRMCLMGVGLPRPIFGPFSSSGRVRLG